ncbi:hypothetical protein [Pseudomonas sp.]|uniref:hypothetical protein n=1 Tax=Pseudomonas sp. TaxID=306 RepID=UPI002487AA09|nr:hypothetical protein [Pseudomonas sp.]MDI1332038.1 hypothetical protein [Pseudomonas sp.]
MASLLQRVPFSNAKKETKGFAPAYGASLKLGDPSLRRPSGSIAYGLPKGRENKINVKSQSQSQSQKDHCLWKACVHPQEQVGCQAAFAGKPRSYKGFAVHASLFTTHQAER